MLVFPAPVGPWIRKNDRPPSAAKSNGCSPAYGPNARTINRMGFTPPPPLLSSSPSSPPPQSPPDPPRAPPPPAHPPSPQTPLTAPPSAHSPSPAERTTGTNPHRS